MSEGSAEAGQSAVQNAQPITEGVQRIVEPRDTDRLRPLSVLLFTTVLV